MDRYLIGWVSEVRSLETSYRARDLTLDRRVIVREYLPVGICERAGETTPAVRCSDDVFWDAFGAGRSRFVYGVRLLARLGDRGALPELLDAFDENGTSYAVMEYIEGSSLFMLCTQSSGVWDVVRALSTIGTVASTLEEVHEEGLAFVDVSPRNIVVGPMGTHLLHADCVTETVPGRSWCSNEAERPFLAPEVLREATASPKSDVFSIAATALWCLTGVVCNRDAAQGPLVPDASVFDCVEGMEQEAKETLVRALSPRPEERPSMAELTQTLKVQALHLTVREASPQNTSRTTMPAQAPATASRAPQGSVAPRPGKGRLVLPIALGLVALAAVVAIVVALTGGGEQGGGTTSETGGTHTPQTFEERDHSQVSVAEGALKDQSQPKSVVGFQVGRTHTALVFDDGTAVGQGYNIYGECDLDSWTDITAVAVGFRHTLGLKEDGSVVAKGRTQQHQCEVGDWEDVVFIACGPYHSLGVRKDGTVRACGDTDSGKLDVGTWTDIVQVATGYGHTVGLKADGTCVSTGYNGDGQCDVSTWRDIVAIAAGAWHTVGLKADGTCVAVGYNEDGRCDVSDWTDVTSISCCIESTVALKDDGTCVATGNNDLGQCEVGKWHDVEMLSAGGTSVVARDEDGTLLTAGSNGVGQIDLERFSGAEVVVDPSDVHNTMDDYANVDPTWGLAAGPTYTARLADDGTVDLLGTGVDVSSWSDIGAIVAGKDHLVGLREDGTCVATGNNASGQCDVGAWTKVEGVAAYDAITIGLREDGTVVAAGNNTSGQCDVSGWSAIASVACCGKTTVGLRADGTVVATGNNDHGQCDVSGWSNIVSVSVGEAHTVGLKADGTVVATGSNEFGQCDVEDWEGITEICVGHNHTVGLRYDGTVVATGDNELGQCDVSAFGDTYYVMARGNVTVAWLKGGNLAAVGDNTYGQCDLEKFEDVLACTFDGASHCVAKQWGDTWVAAGDNSRGQCDVSKWEE